MKKISILGLGGDALMAPEHTETAFWASLGGGADGFVSGVRLSKDKIVVCTNYDDFESTCGVTGKASEMDWEEISKLDAGFMFRSTVIGSDGQPTGERGKDKPWEGNLPKKRAIRVPRLSQILIQFSRRCEIMLLLPAGNEELIDLTVDELKKYGVLNRTVLIGDVSVCNYLKDHFSEIRYALEGVASDQLDAARILGAESLYLDWDIACTSVSGSIIFSEELRHQMAKSPIDLILGSGTMIYAPKQKYIKAIKNVEGIVAIITSGVIPTIEMLSPSALITGDNFDGSYLDRSLWAAGFSHINQDTEIAQQDGLRIKIKEGGSYSGAAAVCLIAIHGRFDAQVDFTVSNPKQGTTFEMAAICIDPGYHHMQNDDLNTRNVNLTFDVHGAPPYASSERDEDDGFRCGWNNGFNLTRVDSDWQASSVNMYNKYGRDVGNGEADNPFGTIRLVRNGSVFTSYYKDKYNKAWVCSGVMLVQNMSDDVYIRLAAKHWNKGGNPPPGNSITFRNFKLYQF